MFFPLVSSNKGITGKIISIIIALVIGMSIVIIYFALFGPERLTGILNKTFFNVTLPSR